MEIITTKKKISKSLINQMRIKLHFNEKSKLLGYFRNVHRQFDNVFLFEYKNTYFIVPIMHINKKSDTQIGTYHSRKYANYDFLFENEIELNKWLIYLNEIRLKAYQIYV